MAYSETIYLVQGDTLPQMKVTIRDKNTAAAGKTLDPDDPATWSIVDLTGCTVRMRIRELGSTTVKETLTATIPAPTLGQAIFTFDSDTLDTAGTFEAEVEYEVSGGGTQSVFDLIKLQVREQF